MEQIRKFYKAFREFFYDHPKFRITLEYLFTFIGSFVSAFIFAFGYKALVDPIIEGKEIGVIITGGLSGISQIVGKIFEIFGFPVNQLLDLYNSIGFIFLIKYSNFPFSI